MYRITLALILLLAFSVHASAREVFFHGVAYLGAYQDINKNYPFTLALNRQIQNRPGRIDQALRSQLEKQKPTHFNLRTGLANLNVGESVVAAVAVDREFVSHEDYVISGKVKTRVIADVSLQVLLIDYENMTLLASEPVAMAMNDLLPGEVKADTAAIEALFERLYFDEDGLLALAVKRLSSLNPENQGLRFQIRKLSSAPAIAKLLPSELSPLQVETYLGQYFTAELAQAYPVSVLPYQRDYAVGRQMAGRFANGSVFNIAIPVPDYEFSISLGSAEKRVLKDKNFYLSRIYFELLEEHSGQVVLADHFRYGVHKFKAKNEDASYDWFAWEDALEELFSGLIEQLAKPSRDWFGVHAKSKNSYQNFKKNRDLYNE